MKIKPIFLYIISFIVIVALIIIFSVKWGQDKTDNSALKDISKKEIPNDDVHKGMNSQMGNPSPGKENISKEFFKMLEKLKKNADENPKDTSKNREYAQILADAHNPKEAIPYFERVLNIDPNRIDVLFYLTICYFNIDDYGKAKLYTQKILNIEKNNFKAFYNLGVIAIYEGDTLKAKQIWNDVINKSSNPQDVKMAKSSLEKLK